MFIVMIHYKKSLAEIDEHLLAHRAYLDEGYQKDYFIASGPRNPRTGGIILSQLSSREKLLEILKEDPFTLNDVVEYEIIEFNPVKYHTNFSSFVG